jgi:hypothetical protein
MNARRRLRIALLGALAALAVCSCLAAPAGAASTSNAIIADCNAHPGGLTGHYTVAQLREALQVMPAEVKEYTSCPDVVNRALLAAIHPGKGGGGSGGGSGSFLPTPVIVILVVLILVAVTFGAVAIRRRGGGGPGGRGGPGAGGDGLS